VRHVNQRLYFINRGDPNSGLYLILLLVLATQALSGRPTREPRDIIAILLSFIIATSIHEFMHAYTAWQLGDSTARDLGRITLNPLAHFEPFGFFGMVMISIGFPFIGWGKPVPVNPSRLRRGPKLLHERGMAVVALAGPVSNVAQALVVAIPLRLMDWEASGSGDLERFLRFYVLVNLLLASFNMIPVPPLDGHKVLLGLLPRFWQPILAPLERYGFLILMLLFFIGGRFGGEIVNAMIYPVYDSLERLVLGSDLRL
jgi:Zn-dependent protease